MLFPENRIKPIYFRFYERSSCEKRWCLKTLHDVVKVNFRIYLLTYHSPVSTSVISILIGVHIYFKILCKHVQIYALNTWDWTPLDCQCLIIMTYINNNYNVYTYFLNLYVLCVLSHSDVYDSTIPCTVARQAPLSMRILQARILEWVVMPPSRGSSQLRNQTQVSCIAGRFFTLWATGEAIKYVCVQLLQSCLTLCDPMD